MDGPRCQSDAMPSPTIRLDQLLVDRRLAASRSRARDAILRGCVEVDGKVCRKPGANVDQAAQIANTDDAGAYVSRAALKLVAGLDACRFDPHGLVALDIGASTGGFSQVLLERGAGKVLAVDVGHGQMDQTLRDDPRIVVLEGVNARDLSLEHLDGNTPDIVVSDLSFISLMKGAEPALLMAAETARAILLVKPQFEVGRAGVGKGGLVKDDALIDETNAHIQGWFNALPGWSVTHFLPSPITGGDGNREFLLCGMRT